MPTPNGVIYQTPGNMDATSPETALTPYNGSANVQEAMSISSETSSEAWESEPDEDPEPLPLLWNGHTRSDVHRIFLNAQNLARTGDLETAEAMLKTSVSGYKYLLGPTHEETSKVIFTIATFYFERDRLQDAYQTLEESCRLHLQTAGIYDRRSQQHVHNVVELLNGWNRQDDALAFLARAGELAKKSHTRSSVTRNDHRRKSLAPSRRLDNAQDSLLLEAARSISDDPQNPTQLGYGLSIASTYGSTKHDAVEQILLTTINQCGQDTERLSAHRLKAWAELLRLYQRTNDAIVSMSSFQKAHDAFKDVLREYPWHERTRRKFESFEVLEAALELIAPFVKANYLDDAKRMLQMCEEKVTPVFGDDDERTIWMYISIGLMYQKYRDWNDAQPWFERALAAAMEKYDENDGIRISLEEAMEVRYFSYVNDEGRPFKTIFGVNGLRIMPTRLHME
jgi:tetratricopeptide (TPR) repeat protein